MAMAMKATRSKFILSINKYSILILQLIFDIAIEIAIET